MRKSSIFFGRRQKVMWYLVFHYLCLSALTACSPAPLKGFDLNAADYSDKRANYIWLRQNVFRPCQYCHGGGGAPVLATYEQFMTVVTPGDPINSRLYKMVATGQMPKGGRLSEEKIRLIYIWIKKGAPEN